MVRRNCNFEGQKYQHSGASPQYVVIDGVLRHIPDPDTKLALFGDFQPQVTDLITFTQTNGIDGFNTADPLNPPWPIPSQPFLLKASDNQAQYMMDFGSLGASPQTGNQDKKFVKRHIRDEPTKTLYGMDKADADPHSEDRSTLNGIFDGDDLPGPNCPGL